MSTLTLNPSLCHGCGTCASECPGFISMDSENHPALNPASTSAHPNCIQCYHCVTVCPHGAIAIDEVTADQCETINQELIPTPKQAAQIVRSRRSVRVYHQKPVERQKIIDLIDIARFAPTARNSQLIRYLIVNSPDKVKRLASLVIDYFKSPLSADTPLRARYGRYIRDWDAGQDPILRGAPALLIAHAPADYPWATVDCAIALSAIDYCSLSFNLGTCWGGIFMSACEKYEPLQKALSLPQGHTCFGALMLGEPAHPYAKIPPRNPAKVTWL